MMNTSGNTGIKLRKQSRSNDEIGSSGHAHPTPNTPLFSTVELVSPRREHHGEYGHHCKTPPQTPPPSSYAPPGIEFRSESSKVFIIGSPTKDDIA